MAKKWQAFVKIAKFTRSHHRPENHCTVYKTQHKELTASLHTVHGIICKIYSLQKIEIHNSTMTSQSHIEPVSNKEHMLEPTTY